MDELFEKAWEAAPQTPPVVPQEALLESPETDDLAVAPTAPVELPATDLDQGAESPVAEEWEVVSIDAAPVLAAADELSEEPIDEPVQTPQVLEPPPELHPVPDQPNAPADAVAPSPAVPRRTRRRRNRGAIRPPPAPPVATQAPLQVVVAETTDSVAGSPVPLIAAPESALISPELLAPEPLAAEAIALEPEVPQRRRRVRWMLLLPVGAILLAVQVGVYFFPAWAADPKMRWLPEQVYAIGGCELEPLKALDQLRIADVVIRAHPDDTNLRLVNVLLVNTAPFEQAFPDIEIAFRAPTNDLVAWKRVTAREYLSASLKDRPVVPERTPVRIEFVIEDPGTQAYGYDINLK